MARIRSVKPEFWTDPEIVALPMAARLFFIGCWNHADDYGVLKDDPGRLKLQILPTDDVDAMTLIALLVTSGHLLRRISPDGTPLLVVRTFTDHQKIDRRAVGRWGHPDDLLTTADPAQSPPIPTNPSDSPPCTGLERTGLEGTSKSVVPPTPEPSTALELVAVPPPATSPQVRQVFQQWVTATDRTTRTVLDPKRKRLIQRALESYPLADVLDAVQGWQHSAHHRGENDAGTPYNDLDLLLRDPAHIEKFRDWNRAPPVPNRPTSVSRGMSAIASVLGGGQ